jgi:hypothetical protein
MSSSVDLQALASEHELMDALFGAEHNDAGGERTKPIPAGGEELWDTKHILDIIFEGVCRPFKVRHHAPPPGTET